MALKRARLEIIDVEPGNQKGTTSWRMRAKNGEIICPPEGFVNPIDAINSSGLLEEIYRTGEFDIVDLRKKK